MIHKGAHYSPSLLNERPRITLLSIFSNDTRRVSGTNSTLIIKESAQTVIKNVIDQVKPICSIAERKLKAIRALNNQLIEDATAIPVSRIAVGNNSDIMT